MTILGRPIECQRVGDKSEDLVIKGTKQQLQSVRENLRQYRKLNDLQTENEVPIDKTYR